MLLKHHLGVAAKKDQILKTTKKTIKKRALHSGEGKLPQKGCTHASTSWCKIDTLTHGDITYNFRRLYDFKEKVQQDRELLLLLKINKASRVKIAEPSRKRARDLTVTYHLLMNEADK